MKSNKILQLIVILLCVLGSFEVKAAAISDDEAIAWADDKANLLLSTFAEKDVMLRYQNLDKLFLEYVDLDYVGKFVSGKYWKTMSAEQQKRYLGVFKRYALSTYKGFPLSFAAKVKYKINGVSHIGDNTNVVAELDLGEEVNGIKNLLLEIRMHRKNNKIQIVDIKVAESSLILSYRNRFYEMFARNDGDVDWFIEDLEEITSSAEQNNQERLDNLQY